MPGVSTPGALGGSFLQSPQRTWQRLPPAPRFPPEERARLSPAVPGRGQTGRGRAGHLPRAPCSLGHRRLALTAPPHPRPAGTGGAVRARPRLSGGPAPSPRQGETGGNCAQARPATPAPALRGPRVPSVTPFPGELRRGPWPAAARRAPALPGSGNAQAVIQEADEPAQGPSPPERRCGNAGKGVGGGGGGGTLAGPEAERPVPSQPRGGGGVSMAPSGRGSRG